MIAVFDIGKTNKKFTLFSGDLKPVKTVTTRIEERKVGNLLCDDVKAIEIWMKDILKEYGKDVEAIAVTTFGATIALLNREDNLVLPVISYNQDVEENIRKKFFEEFGSPEELYMRTGTPPLGGLLNVGLQLYWVSRKWPEKYGRVCTVLFLPQYLSKKLVGKDSIEITSLGCHTYLYDILLKGWSNVAEGLEVPSKASEMFNVWDVLGRDSEGRIITPGIHDSNASLLPYLVSWGNERFVLASTGTWCVFMCPGLGFTPKREDVYKDTLYYIDAYSRPVRSSRFKCGYEFDYYSNLIEKLFKVDPRKIEVNPEILLEVIREQVFITPTLTPGTGQFPWSKSRIIGEDKFRENPVKAYHILNVSLAAQTVYALKSIGFTEKIIVQGGFARNTVYLKALATLLPNSKILRASYPEATSLGTALTAKAALEGVDPRKVYFDKSVLEVEEVKGLEVEDKYVESFLQEFCRKALEGAER